MHLAYDCGVGRSTGSNAHNCTWSSPSGLHPASAVCVATPARMLSRKIPPWKRPMAMSLLLKPPHTMRMAPSSHHCASQVCRVPGLPMPRILFLSFSTVYSITSCACTEEDIMHLKMLRGVLEARPSPFHSSGGRFGKRIWYPYVYLVCKTFACIPCLCMGFV